MNEDERSRNHETDMAGEKDSCGVSSRPPKPTVSRLLVYAAALIVLFLIVCALAPQWIARYSPTDMQADQILLPPGAAHWMGTDYFGRDVFSVIVYGARESLFIGFASVIVGGLSGGAIGLCQATLAAGWTTR